MHREFEGITARLEELYSFARRTQNDRISGIVVGIYAKASTADAILRDRILKEVGEYRCWFQYRPILNELPQISLPK